MAEFIDVVKKRRSIYDVGTDTDLSLEDIVERLKEVVNILPTAFHSQTTRFVVVTGEANEKVWDIIHSDQKGVLDETRYNMMKSNFEQAKNGIGTILLFEDREAVERIPSNPTRSEVYKENNNGIASYAVWLILTDLGLGASLQHFNVGYEKGYDKEIREYLELPDSWEMLAQMPFGSIETEARDKKRIDQDEQVVVIDK